MANNIKVTRDVESPEALVEKVPEAKRTHDVISSDVVPPFTSYEQVNNNSFLADEYGIDKEIADVYGQELDMLKEYFTRKINSGEIADSVEAVKKELKKMEKLHNLKDESRTAVKMGVLTSYIKFLNEREGIYGNVRRYGTG